MRDSLVGLLEKTDLTIASCRGVVLDERLDVVAQAAKNVRVRLSYPEDVIVAALAGGTGSGKSSILNVIADREVADVGGVRPTTSSPIAVVAPEQADVMSVYLEELGIASRVVDASPPWLVLIDLPDTDSVVVDHRLQVAALLPRIDVVVWVTDPEKYRDAALHDRFLRPLAAYAPQLFFVLNQIDRLAEESVESVLTDFAAALRDDGIEDSLPLATAASPPSGPPIGISELLNALEMLTDSRVGLYSKLLTDLTGAVANLGDVVGTGLDFDERFGEVITRAADMVVDGNPGEATSLLTQFVENLAAEIGGPGGEEVNAVAVDIPSLVLSVAETLGEKMTAHRVARPLIRWSEKGDTMPRNRRFDLVRAGLVELEPPLREVVSRRAVATAALSDLSVSLVAASSGAPVISGRP